MAVQAENMCFENMGFAPFANICSSQDCFMGSFWGFDQDGFCLQESQTFDQQNMELHGYENLAFSSSCLPVDLMQSLSSDLEKQRLEIDWFLQLENKRLRRFILQQETQFQALLIRKYESIFKTLMQKKDEELFIARNKTRELQAFLSTAEMEAKSWEKKAIENEALIFNLNNRLNQAQEEGDKTASFCDSNSSDQEKIILTGDQEQKMGCKLCQARRSSVVFLPCRHLCCCKFCDSLLGHCPVCNTVKEASLEALVV